LFKLLGVAFLENNFFLQFMYRIQNRTQSRLSIISDNSETSSFASHGQNPQGQGDQKQSRSTAKPKIAPVLAKAKTVPPPNNSKAIVESQRDVFVREFKKLLGDSGNYCVYEFQNFMDIMQTS
jgi:hypothetical protein